MRTPSRAVRSVCWLLAVVIGVGFSASPPQPASAQTGWNLVWSDEFNGPSIDTTSWGYELGHRRPETGEIQYYTDRPENARIENGNLLIEGRRENYAGAQYTSASLVTQGKHEFQYDRVEMRAKLPSSKGAWPAFWTMGWNVGCWPTNGEIDVMELVGGDNRDNQIHGVAHWSTDLAGCSTGHTRNGGSYQLPSGIFADAYHTFAVERDATQIRWYVDGLHYHTLDITAANPLRACNNHPYVDAAVTKLLDGPL